MHQKLKNNFLAITVGSILFGCGGGGTTNSSSGSNVTTTTITCSNATPGTTITVSGQNYLVVDDGVGVNGAKNPTNLAELSNGTVKYCTSLLTDLQGLFNNSNFNQPIDNWDTSNVTDMSGLFRDNSMFNQALNSWDTSNVTNMSDMFHGASSFNQPIGNWNTSKVTTIASMFESASSFNQAVDTNQVIVSRTKNNTVSLQSTNYTAWDTSKMTDMSSIFALAFSFNQPLNNWNTGNVTSMFNMFSNATSFNQPLNNWNTAKVTDMSFMFQVATSFNQPLANWNTGKVTDMSYMFAKTTSFNQPLANWNTSNVTNMNSMFRDVTGFNQDLSAWNVAKIAVAPIYFNLNGSSEWISNQSYQPVWGAPTPTVTMTQPSPTTNVSTSPSIQLTFTQAVNNVNGNSVQLHSGSVTGTLVAIESITANSSSGSTIGNTVFTFSPKAALSDGITYYVTVSESPATSYGKSVVATNFNFTTTAAVKTPHIFVTALTYNGNLDGVSGANAKCNADSNKLSGYTYKALLITSSVLPGTADWMILPNTAYYNSTNLNQIIATSNESGIFNTSNGNLNSPISTLSNSVWTGITPSGTGDTFKWTYSDRFSTCGTYNSQTHSAIAWTNDGLDTNEVTGVSGITDSLTGTAFNSQTEGCDQLKTLYCVSQ